MIPPKTQEKLSSFHPKGTRHKAKLDIALSLLGEGQGQETVIATLREKFPQSRPGEIERLVEWAAGRNPEPCGGETEREETDGATAAQTDQPSKEPGRGFPNRGRRAFAGAAGKTQAPPLEPQEAVAALLSGPRRDLISPVTVPEEPAAGLRLLFESLYGPEEYLNIVTKFTQPGGATQEGPAGKACPLGAGANKTREEWLSWFEKHGAPFSAAGAWMRPNPVGPTARERTGRSPTPMSCPIGFCSWNRTRSRWPINWPFTRS